MVGSALNKILAPLWVSKWCYVYASAALQTEVFSGCSSRWKELLHLCDHCLRIVTIHSSLFFDRVNSFDEELGWKCLEQDLRTFMSEQMSLMSTCIAVPVPPAWIKSMMYAKVCGMWSLVLELSFPWPGIHFFVPPWSKYILHHIFCSDLSFMIMCALLRPQILDHLNAEVFSNGMKAEVWLIWEWSCWHLRCTRLCEPRVHQYPTQVWEFYKKWVH